MGGIWERSIVQGHAQKQGSGRELPLLKLAVW